MKRSIRDALVGFSIIGTLALFGGSLLWLKGIKVGSKTWEITADFSDATGLSEKSAVTYRGIIIGSVGKIKVNPETVSTQLKINNNELILPLPVTAKIVTSSLLGGDVQVSLISSSKEMPKNLPGPILANCPTQKILCNGASISGESLTSISSVTESIERILNESEGEDIVSNLISSAKQFDLTQKNLDDLIAKMKTEVNRLEPMMNNLNKSSKHIKNILSAIDNPKTLDDIQKTVSSANSLSKKIDSVGGQLEEIMKDEDLMNAIKNVTFGLGELFKEIYPQNDN